MANGQTRRLERVGLIRQLRSGRIDGRLAIIAPPPPLEGMFVFDLLTQVPGVGPTVVREINERAVRLNINLAVGLRDLAPSHREWLARMVECLRRRRPLASRPQG